MKEDQISYLLRLIQLSLRDTIKKMNNLNKSSTKSSMIPQIYGILQIWSSLEIDDWFYSISDTWW